MTAHARFGASSAHRWADCPGALTMEEQYGGKGNSSSPAALAGTIGHAAADEALRLGCSAYEVHNIIIENEVHVVPDDTQEAVQFYIEFIRARPGTIVSEVKIDYSTLIGVGNSFGTSDAVVLGTDGSVEIWDLKLGRRWVDATNNKQLLLYAAGVVDVVEATTGVEVPSVTVGIIQPHTSRTPSYQELTRIELHDAVAVLKTAADSVTAADTSYDGSSKWHTVHLNPGEHQCQWCKAAAHCPALAKATVETVALCTGDDFDVVSKPTAVGDSALAMAYDRIPLLEIFIKAVEGECFSRASKGIPVKGQKLVLGREGNRKWADETVAKESLISVLPFETIVIESTISPAAAEKELKKLKIKDFNIETLVVRSAAKPTLVQASDPREAFVANTADDFS
jgi:hypothetical protein